MLTHDERFALARTFCARMMQRYMEQIIVGGVYGSTASGMDTRWSDLELLFVVADGSGIATRPLLYRGVAVGLHAIEQATLEELLREPSAAWPYWMGVLSALRVLHGEAWRVAAWLRMGQSVSRERFRLGLANALPALVFESYGRILSCQARGNADDIGCAAIEVLLEMRTALCLLNRRWATHDYFQGIAETFAFPHVPFGYAELATALWRAHGIEEIVPAARALMESYLHLLTEEGFSHTGYQAMDEVAL